MPLPKVIQEAPELLPGLALYYNGFVELSSCRQVSGHGESPIPWTAIRDYCNEFDIEGEQRDYFFILIREMDKAYFEHLSKKTKTKNGNP